MANANLPGSGRRSSAEKAQRVAKAALIAKALQALNALKRKLPSKRGTQPGATFPNGAAPGATPAALQAKLALAYLYDLDSLQAMLGQLESALADAERLELEAPEWLDVARASWASAVGILPDGVHCLTAPDVSSAVGP